MFSALSGDVPLVGRNTLIAGIEDAVREADVYGALVYGATGTGKSALARHLLTRFQGEFAPFLVTPAAALGGIPYGALAPFLVDASAEDMSSPLSVLRRVMAFLRARAAGRPVLLLVDDAHLLDDDSSHLLAQLVTSRTIGLAAFARPVTPVSDELASLCRDGLLERFDVGPLPSDEAFELCSLVLGAMIVRGASDRLCDEASGNPLFLKAILDEAVARGSLTRPDGVWTLDTDEVSLPAALVDLVRSSTLGLDPLGRKAFDVVVLADTVAFTDLVRLSSEGAVSVLLDEGLVRGVPDDPALATSSSSLYGRIGRSLVPVGRSSMLHGELRSVVEPGVELPPRAAIRNVLWSLECGEAVPDDQLVDVAELALTRLDPRSVLRCASAVRDERLLGIARIHRATALLELGRLDESRRVVDELAGMTIRPRDVAAAGILAIRHAVADGKDLLVTEEILGWWSAVLGSWSGESPAGPNPAAGRGPAARPLMPAVSPDDLHRQPEPEAEMRDSEQHLVVARAFCWNLVGDYGKTVELLAPFVTAGGTDRRVGILAHALLAEALGVLGRAAEALRHSLAAVAAAGRRGEPVPDLHRTATFRHIGLLVHGGDFPAAEEALVRYDPGGDRDYSFIGGGLAVLDAALDARRGFFRAALLKLRPALASLRASDQDGLLPYALGMTAWAAAALGETALVAHCSKELAAVQHRGSRQYALLGLASDAAAHALLGRDPGGSGLAECAAAARRHGWDSAEKEILELATVLGDVHAAPLLKEVTSDREGVEAAVLHAYASALVDGDAAALAAAGDGAESMQKYLVATYACRRAMDLYAEEGDARSQRALAAVLRRRRSRIDGGLVEEPFELEGGTPLTSREQEIALLAIRGLTNREIARSLTVSTRTVEGHLYRIYVKLGISRRDELTEEMGTWLRGT